MSKIAILGGGAWGTALSVVLSRSRRSHELSLWVRDHSLALAMAATRENKTYLPGIEIPARITLSSDLAATLEHAQISHLRRSLGPHSRGLHSGNSLHFTGCDHRQRHEGSRTGHPPAYYASS